MGRFRKVQGNEVMKRKVWTKHVLLDLRQVMPWQNVIHHADNSDQSSRFHAHPTCGGLRRGSSFAGFKKCTISQVRQFATTWGCTAQVFHPQPFTSSEHDAHLMYPGQDPGFDITQTFRPKWLTPKGWQDMTKVGHVQTKHFLLPSIVVDDVIPSGSGSVGFSCPPSDYQSRPTAHTGNNLRLSNMGTSPSAFRWHLLSMMHVPCILLMIPCCSPTLQECQSGLVSVPGLCLQSSTTASICLLDFSASRIFRRWIRHHTHSHQNGWQDTTKFGHVQTKHCYLPSKPFNCGRWCYSKWQWFCGSHYKTISQKSSY